MFNHVTIKLLGKLKILAKNSGVHIDLVKMEEDSAYAALMLKELSNSENPELILIVIKLMNHYGLIEAPIDLEKSVDASDKDFFVKNGTK